MAPIMGSTYQQVLSTYSLIGNQAPVQTRNATRDLANQ